MRTLPLTTYYHRTYDDTEGKVITANESPNGDQLTDAAHLAWDNPPARFRGANVVSMASDMGRSDAANVERMLALFGDDVRYVAPWKKWLVWDGKRWKLDDSNRVQQLGLKFAGRLWEQLGREAPDVTKETLGKMQTYIKRTNDVGRMDGTLKMMAPYVSMSPDQLDADPMLFNVDNGTIDLANGSLRPHSKSDLITQLAPVRHDVGAQCPTWCRFVRDICNDDPDVVRYIQSLCGYSLLGKIVEHLIAFLFGNGANGKSTFIEILLAIFGDYGMKANAEMLLTRKSESHPTERADLFRKRLVVAVEADAGRSFAESLLKEFTGGDTIRARRMKENFWSFTPSHTVWLAANHKPIVKGTDDGFWRRMKLIPFMRQWDTDGSKPDLPPADKRLSSKLHNERSGILMWVVAGLATWQAEGLQTPQAVADGTKDYRFDSDIIGQFAAEECIVGPDKLCRGSELYEAYARWCESNGLHPISNTAFGRDMTNRGYIVKRTMHGHSRLGIRPIRVSQYDAL